jgi:hypothetical protein
MEYNMEGDLITTDWIIDKVKEDMIYAQHLYAALCNNDFVKNEIWPLLQDKRWGCSWRAAGGIIADMQQKGDYMDWYCSGIQDIAYDDDNFRELSKEHQTQYLQQKAYVSEGVVTDEIRADLLKLGWTVLANDGPNRLQ